MLSYQMQLLSILAKVLFDRGRDIALTEEILHEARLQAVSSLVSNKEYALLSNNICVCVAHANLAKTLKDIPYVTIKGYASAYYYPTPCLRPMGDVDFYIDKKDLDETITALTNAGFQRTKSKYEKHLTFTKNKEIHELHMEIKGAPNGEDGIKSDSEMVEERINNYFSNLIETAKRISTPYGEIVIPDDFHHGLIMLLHVAAHILNDGGVGLRHLCDWAVYVDKVDLSRFRKELEEVGLWYFACMLTATCTKYLGLREMNWIERNNDDLIDKMIEEIMSGGNFGKKDKTRRIVGRLVEGGSIKTSLCKMVKNRFPILRRYPILLPAVFVWWGIGYLGRCITGKRRRIKVDDIMKIKGLYKDYKLFEPVEDKTVVEATV